MKKIVVRLLLVFGMVAGLTSIGLAADPAASHDWRAMLKPGGGREDLAGAIAAAHATCVPAGELEAAAIHAGYDPYLVVKTVTRPETIPGGCTCEVVSGALAAGVSDVVVMQAAIDGGAERALVEKGLAYRGSGKDDRWRAAIKKAPTETELGQAIANAVGSCVPVSEVVKTALDAGHASYPVINTTARAAGPNCVCGVAAGALAAGYTPGEVIKAAALDPCACKDAPLPYTNPKPPPEPPPPPPPPVSPAAPR